jgi:hypothetical protein
MELWLWKSFYIINDFERLWKIRGTIARVLFQSGLYGTMKQGALRYKPGSRLPERGHSTDLPVDQL